MGYYEIDKIKSIIMKIKNERKTQKYFAIKYKNTTFALPKTENIKISRYEKNIPTITAQASQQTWLPRAHVDSKRTSRIGSSPSSRPQEIDCLI